MSEKYCPGSVSDLSFLIEKCEENKEMPKITKPTSNNYIAACDWSDSVVNIKSKWSIGLQCSDPVIFFLSF